MNRAIVLIGCLAAAGAVGAYTHYSEEPADQPPVFTVHTPQRPAEPAPAAPERAVVPPRDRGSLTRALQRELTRVGCYDGEINGVWTTSSRMAMKSFVDHVNASLPIDNPDQILLSLVQAQKDTVCGPRASTADSRSPAETPSESKATNPAVPAAAAAAAVAASAAIAKGNSKTLPEDQARPAAASRDDPSKAARPDSGTRHSGPVPPEGVYKRKHRSRRYTDQARPPKIVRNILRAFGIR